MATRRVPRTRPKVETPVASRVSVGMGAGGGGMKPERKWQTSSYPTDKHRRRYHVTVSTITGTAIHMLPLFRAPIMPPADCVRVPEEQPWHVDIDYQKWLTRTLAEDREHLQIRRAIAQKEYKELARGKEKSERVLELSGPVPGEIPNEKGYASNSKLVALAFHGDPWALGKQKERTAAVEAIIGPAPEEMDLGFLLDTKGKFSSEVAKLLGEAQVAAKDPTDASDEDNWEPGDDELEDAAIKAAEEEAQNAGMIVLEDSDLQDNEDEDSGPTYDAAPEEEDRVQQYGTEPVAAPAPSLRELAALEPPPQKSGKKGKAARPPAGGK